MADNNKDRYIMIQSSVKLHTIKDVHHRKQNQNI